MPDKRPVLNADDIPDCYMDSLSSGLLAMLRRIQAMPGGQEMLDEKKREMGLM